MKTIYYCHDQQFHVGARKNELETAGYQLVLFQTGGDLMRAIAREEPDLVLMDTLLEGKNGFETAAGLDLVERSRFPVFLFAGIYTRRIFHEEAERLGVTRYLESDIGRDELLEAIATALGSTSQGQRAA